jgi:hypothetical protein
METQGRGGLCDCLSTTASAWYSSTALMTDKALYMLVCVVYRLTQAATENGFFVYGCSQV